MGVYSTGNSYGVPEDLIYSFPVSIKVCHETFPKSVSDISISKSPHQGLIYWDQSWDQIHIHIYSSNYNQVEKYDFSHHCNISLFLQGKTWKIVDGLAINDFSRAKMDATAAELVEERDTAVSFLGVWLETQPYSPFLDAQKTPEARLWNTPENLYLPLKLLHKF